MARLLVTLGTRDAGGAAAVDARGSVTVAARTRRGAAGAATAGPWAAGRRWATLLALGWLVQVGLRVWFSRHQVMPLANPDETAYLVTARVLAGGPAADLSDSTLYPGGYPLLITPAYWFSSDPSTVYHAVMVINAVISALVLPLGYLACRRLGLGRPAAYGAPPRRAVLLRRQGRPLAFGGPGKTPAELAGALELAAAPGGGTTRFHVESPHELALLDQAARAAGRRADVLLRVNLPGQEEQAALVMGGKPSPFGMDCELLRRCTPFPPSVRLRGLHAHLASGVGADGLLAAAGRLVSFGRQWCAEQGVTEPEFNLGGGMAVDYTRPDGVFDWAGYGRGLAGLARPGETLRIEPGRAVTAYCGWYLTRVLDVKHSHGEAFAVVAGGTHHLRTPAAKGHDQPFAVVAVDDWALPWPRPGVRDEAVTIAGQLCTPKDVLARRVRVGRPRALRVGDLVAFGLAGAYA